MQFEKLKTAGLTRVHNNLETSQNYFPQMCSTHTFLDKVNSINDAKAVGMSVCSGGIFGIGESMQDRVDLAISLRELDIKSVPINFLIAVDGTPCQGMKSVDETEARYIVAMFRFALPKAFIRLAGGRILLQDSGRGCFLGGANACITGDLLTTAGESVIKDREMIESLGYNIIQVFLGENFESKGIM